MIVQSMTPLEIGEYIRSEHVSVSKKENEIRDKFAKMVLRRKRGLSFQKIEKTYYLETKNKTVFEIKLAADRPSQARTPTTHISIKYHRPEGIYVALLDDGNNDVVIFPPHFWQRYRERIMNDMTLSVDELATHFTSVNQSIITGIARDGIMLDVSDVTTEEIEYGNFFGMCSEGVVVGSRFTDSIIMVKTVLSYEQLNENQKNRILTMIGQQVNDIFHEMQKEAALGLGNSSKRDYFAKYLQDLSRISKLLGEMITVKIGDTRYVFNL